MAFGVVGSVAVFAVVPLIVFIGLHSALYLTGGALLLAGVMGFLFKKGYPAGPDAT